MLRYVIGLAAGGAVLLASPAAQAQSFDGTYAGTISCGLLTHLTRPLKTEFSMTVSGSEAKYQREIFEAQYGGQLGGSTVRLVGT